MAKRLYFKCIPNSDTLYEEKYCEFEYFNGFSLSQKQKSIAELHNNIKQQEPLCEILEVSSKSANPLGWGLSAFNLKVFDEILSKVFFLENVFQSSKVFEFGGPYRDLLDVSPREAKRDERLKNSGKLTHFLYHDNVWPLIPKTIFYDWLYLKALSMNTELSDQIMKYNIFTDIEFNHNKSINCQARSVAIYVSLRKSGFLNKALVNYELMQNLYHVYENYEQITMF